MMKQVVFYIILACVVILAGCERTIGPSFGPTDYSGVQYKFDGKCWEEVQGRVIEINSMQDNPVLEFRTIGVISVENLSGDMECLLLDSLEIEDYKIKNEPDEIVYRNRDELMYYYLQRVRVISTQVTQPATVKVRFNRCISYGWPTYTDCTLILK